MEGEIVAADGSLNSLLRLSSTMQSSTSLPGAHIGKYQLLALIASGGMGHVYKAKDERLGRIVALKILSPELSRNPVLVERFRREARHAACLTHKNIVALFEADEADGYHYLAMEFVEGVDLAEYIRRKGQLHPEESRRILIQACKALEHAFTMGITHRDIKPSNFLLANDEGRCRVKLTDLGLSRMQNDEEFRVTTAGCTVGTVDYMAPEQARDSALADVRSDIYSLGCTLYHMVAGAPPFSEGGIGERVYKHMSIDPVDVRTHNPSVPAGLWTVLRRMMAKHPDDRFQTPGDLIEALRSIPSDLDDSSSDSSTTTMKAPRLSNQPPSDPNPTPRHLPIAQPSPPKTPMPVAPFSSKERPLSTSTPARRPLTTSTELKATSEKSDPLGITVDQRSNASAQYARATEVISGGTDVSYAVRLLLNCCGLDPHNVLYRKMLREVVRDKSGGKRAGWLGSLTRLPSRRRLKAALRAGDYRKVIENGEELLTRHPGDVPTQIDMAHAAQSLELSDLVTWLLEQARGGAPENLDVLRALGSHYGDLKRFAQAAATWETVRKIDPTDAEAAAKVKEMGVAETLSGSSFRR
jgi:serine/threonine protein kinase